MKYTLSFSNQFKYDFKTVQKRGYDIIRIQKVFGLLESGVKLPINLKAHKLSGNYSECWECHIKSDWLLIWRQNDQNKTIELVRTGTHSDLF